MPDVVARLLHERWGLAKDDELAVEVDEAEGSVAAQLKSGASIFHGKVLYRSGAGPDRDPWMLLVDALDALLGQLEEGDRNHRMLPSGEGVEFQGVQLQVSVERSVPELQRVADQLLAGADEGLR